MATNEETTLLESKYKRSSSIEDNSVSSETRKSFSTRQILLLLNLVTLKFLENFSGCLPLAFFARVTELKGGTLFEASFSMQMRMLAYVISSALFGYYLTKFNTGKFIFVCLLGVAVSQLALGLLDYVNNLPLFVAGASVSRLIFGLGKGGVAVAANVIAMQECPHMMSTAIGLIQAGSAAGRLLGAGVGGILYDHYGMAIPVIASSASLFVGAAIQCPLIFLHYGKQEDESSNKFSFPIMKFLCTPLVFSLLLLIFSSYGILAYADVALTLYFERKDLSTTLAGVGLMIWGCSYGGFSVIVGFVASRYAQFGRFSVGVGGILYSGAMFAFTPNQTVVLIYTACFFLGVFLATSMNPSMEQLLLMARTSSFGKPDDPSIVGKVAGIWQVSAGLGMFVSPTVTSLVQSLTSSTFTHAFYGLSVVNILLATVQLLCTVFLYRTKSREQSSVE